MLGKIELVIEIIYIIYNTEIIIYQLYNTIQKL